VRYFKVGNTTAYSDHRPISAALTTDCGTDFVAGDSLKELEGKLTLVPKPFKWTKDASTGFGTTEKFKSAQNDPQFIQGLDTFLQKTISSADDVRNYNESIIMTYTNLASQVTSQKSGRRWTNKNKWFDWSCRKSKRLVCKDERVKNKPHIDPMSVESNRSRFYLRKKEYRAQVRSKKGAYLFQRNEKINNGKNINWAALKDLSYSCKDPDTFDLYDLVAFHKFFNDLYSQKCKDPSHGELQSSTHDANGHVTESHPELPTELEPLNKDFT
jgi:hypothetical protein